LSFTRALPRVTYSNVHEDFSGVHALLDGVLAAYEPPGDKVRPNIIAGKPEQDGRTYAVVSPIDSSLKLADLVDASPAAVERAVAAARSAQRTWAKRGWEVRVSIVRRVADALSARKYEIGAANLVEVGKSRMEAMGEVEEAVDMIRHFCADLEANQGFVRSLARAVPGERTVSILRPYGVFGVIAPFNFPVALSFKMIIPAILCGNTVVYKPSPNAALTAHLILEILAEAGVPAGVVNLICGENSGKLLADAKIDALAFTGSHEVGMSLFRKLNAGSYARPVLAEMGGKNPVYVAASADLDVAAEGVARSAFGLQGQKCSAAEVAYIDNAIYDQFVGKLLDYTRTSKIGDPRRQEVFMGPVINKEAYQTYVAAVGEARAHGKVLFGGKRLSGGLFDKGYYVEPTIVADLPANSSLHTQELFLPFIALRRYKSLESAITEGNKVDYGLTAGAYAKGADLELFLERTEAGVLYANRRSGATTGAWPGFQTFAGWKGSGISGKGGFGPYDLPQFMREQSHTIMEDDGG
jgi:1-pyrroline-5-carboxylate dehydrogenase